MNNQGFQLPGSYKKWTIGLIIAGVAALLYGLIMLHPFTAPAHHGAEVAGAAHGAEAAHNTYGSTRFWAVLLQNSVYWLLVVNSAMFFIGVTTLAMGGWQVALKRVPEAISSVVPILGGICLLVLLALVFGHRTDIYHWLDADAVAKDKILTGKKGFLNPVFFTIWSIVAIGSWTILGAKMRKLSQETDANGTMDYETSKKWIWKNTVWGSLFLVMFGLTVASTIPWLWLMSIDAHWYSTMYSWWTFAGTFVAGLSLVALYIVFLKGQGRLEFVSQEHLHDIGKFMFAFSVFWTYLWFSQYMLIWYSNQTEETRYFVDRIGTAEKSGPYHIIFFLILILNFLCPLLILMTRGAKRNWNVIAFIALVIIFGQWLNFYMMVMPGTVGEHSELNLFEYGVPCLFIGIIMWGTGRYLEKHPLEQKNHPFMKESIIHHT